MNGTIEKKIRLTVTVSTIMCVIHFFSCHHIDNYKNTQDSAIVVITENAPETGHYKFENGIMVLNKGNIAFIDTLMDEIRYQPHSKKK
jgi:hypothetical protein